MAPDVPPFVDPAWLRAHRDDPDLVLADVRWYLDGRSGQAAYAAGHLPGAVYVELDGYLAGPPGPRAGRHPLPDPEVFAEGMAAAGIGDDTLVIAYDDAGGVIAARLVWLLRVTGHPAALLDGGLLGWPGPHATEPPPVARRRFTVQPWPAARLASIDEVTDPGLIVLDARPAERYRGEQDDVDPRLGHIPGARSLPCRENVDDTGRLLPEPVLRERLAALGVPAREGADAGEPAAAVVSYCGSGVTACHTLLVLEHLGLGRGRLYPGAWSQYSHTDRPAEMGPGAGWR